MSRTVSLGHTRLLFYLLEVGDIRAQIASGADLHRATPLYDFLPSTSYTLNFYAYSYERNCNLCVPASGNWWRHKGQAITVLGKVCCMGSGEEEKLLMRRRGGAGGAIPCTPYRVLKPESRAGDWGWPGD